jgi:RimJ/RimL family protein N-acetyltransferase
MHLETPLETEHLILRTLAPEAGDGPYLEWMNDADVMRFTESRFTQHTAAGLRDYVEAMNASPNSLLMGLFYKVPEEHIGNIKLGSIDPHHHRADVGIIIGRAEYWGRGLATEAIRALTEYAFGTLGLHRVSAGCYETNRASIRAFQKAGFHEDARLEGYRLSDDIWIDDVVLCRLAGSPAK